MRATKAYIASLGTTGVLLAASILMLAVVSAVVAFDRWPSGTVSTRVETLTLADRPTPIRVDTSAKGSAAARDAAAARRAGASAPRGSARGAHPVAPNVAGERFSGEGRTPGSPATLPVKTSTPAVPGAPDLPEIDPTNPKGLANSVAQQTEAASGSLGGAVGQLNPDTGQLVTQLGQRAAEEIGAVPLPGH